jgi:hypothetical protein
VTRPPSAFLPNHISNINSIGSELGWIVSVNNAKVEFITDVRFALSDVTYRIGDVVATENDNRRQEANIAFASFSRKCLMSSLAKSFRGNYGVR